MTHIFLPITAISSLFSKAPNWFIFLLKHTDRHFFGKGRRGKRKKVGRNNKFIYFYGRIKGKYFMYMGKELKSHAKCYFYYHHLSFTAVTFSGGVCKGMWGILKVFSIKVFWLNHRLSFGLQK